MEDLYLKFPDQQTAEEVLAGYEGSIDVIGEIAQVDNTNPENPVVTTVPGWHVNIRGPVTLELEAFVLKPEPSTPLRVWL